MTDQDALRAKAEKLAAERFGNPDAELLHPDESEIIREQVYGFTTGYLTARTISTGELEAAAEAIALKGHNDGCFDEVREWEALEEWEREAYPGEYPGMAYEDRDHALSEARAALTAAGLLIEGDGR